MTNECGLLCCAMSRLCFVPRLSGPQSQCFLNRDRSLSGLAQFVMIIFASARLLPVPPHAFSFVRHRSGRNLFCPGKRAKRIGVLCYLLSASV
eukprot:6457769-Amphidinium_carterae.3